MAAFVKGVRFGVFLGGASLGFAVSAFAVSFCIRATKIAVKKLTNSADKEESKDE